MRKLSRLESVEEGGKVVSYGVRDVREKGKGGSGGGGGEREKDKGKRRGKDVCEVCMGVCYGAVRALGILGEVGESAKV